MSEQAPARKRSRRSPAAAAETPASRQEEELSEVTAAPVDPKSTTGYRLALGAVISLGVLILIGVAILFIGLAKGWGHKPATLPETAKKPISMGLEPGYRILSSETQPGRLILHVRSDASDEVYIFDLADGHIIAVIKGEAPK
jgi:hypothetical protein